LKNLPCIHFFNELSEASGFNSLMHFSYYLMIAALALVGFEVIFALYQLASFVL